MLPSVVSVHNLTLACSCLLCLSAICVHGYEWGILGGIIAGVTGCLALVFIVYFLGVQQNEKESEEVERRASNAAYSVREPRGKLFFLAPGHVLSPSALLVNRSRGTPAGSQSVTAGCATCFRHNCSHCFTEWHTRTIESLIFFSPSPFLCLLMYSL